MCRLASLHREGKGGLSKDYKRIKQLYQGALAKFDGEISHAFSYDEIQESWVEFLENESAQKNPDAFYELGKLAYTSGNYSKAEEWFRKAKEAGHPDAAQKLKELEKRGPKVVD